VDVLDFDVDTDTSELAVDLDVNPWRIFGADVDMGAYELTFVSESCVGDCQDSDFEPNPDGEVDGFDLAVLLGSYGACAPPCCLDFVGDDFLPPPDGVIDSFDLAVLLGAWGSCEESLTVPSENPLEHETLGPMLEELMETGDEELAESIAALLTAMLTA
jgi:hypothetical protein